MAGRQLGSIPGMRRVHCPVTCPMSLSGLEFMEELERLAERVAVMGLKTSEDRLQRLGSFFVDMWQRETMMEQFKLTPEERGLLLQ